LWLGRHLPGRPHPEIKRPLNLIRLGYSVVGIISLVTGVVALWPRIQPLIQSKNLWAGVCLTAILIFTSGHMYNQIRGVPYVAGNGRGGVQYFSSSFQSQFGMETQIIAGLYGVLAFSAISLATRVSKMSRESSRTLAVVMYCIILLVSYSFLLRVFRIKNSGYPFSLPPFL
jgi:oligosaccharyltransferase complex subunit gamma